MESRGVLGFWPLQRLLQMVKVIQTKDNELWKQSSFLSVIDPVKDVSSEDRDAIVAWLLKLNTGFHFHHETFFLAASILDRFISSIKVQPKYLKCIALSCLYLASKITEEEDVIPRTGELVKESECGCRVCDVIRMERIILEKLSWNIHSSTVLDYLHVFQALSFCHFTDYNPAISLPRRMNMLANVTAKLLCKTRAAKFPNAALALGLVSIELEALGSDPDKWTRVTGQLQLISKVSTGDMMQCREYLLGCLPSRLIKKSIFKPIHLNRAPLPSSSTPSETKAHASSQVVLSGGGCATKRKAATPSPTKIIELSKKPHPESASPSAPADNTALLSSVMTSAAFQKMEKRSPSVLRRLTYAEIVKFGLNGVCESKTENDILTAADQSLSDSEVTRQCGFEAGRSFMSPLSSPYGNQPRIRT